MRSDDQANDTCGCCKGIKALTPATLENLPGLPALAYRIGTHSSFKTTMKAALSGKRDLEKLTIRDDDDPSIALIDAWACVLDVLTFYQERIANEGYLLTATERGSVLELARTIGYELRPGVAASTFLAFTLEDAPGTPGYAAIDTGTKVMSIPGQDERPQTFETVEKIEARTEWNELKPRLTEPKIPDIGSKEVYLKGTATGLNPGDILLFIGKGCEKYPENECWDFRTVKTITADIAAGYTEVTWEEGLEWKRFKRKVLPAEEKLRVFVFRLKASLFGHNAPDWRAMHESIKRAYLGLESRAHIPASSDEWPDFNIPAIGNPEIGKRGLCAEYFDGVDLTNRKMTRIDPEVKFDWRSGSPDPAVGTDNFSVRWTGFVQPESTRNYKFHTISDDGVKLWINGELIIDNWTIHSETENSSKAIPLEFGHAYSIKLEYYERSGLSRIELHWSSNNVVRKKIIPQAYLCPDTSDIYLDASYPQILPGSWVLLSTSEHQELYCVKKAAEDSKANFTLTTKTTCMTLGGESLSPFFNKLRETSIFAQSEQLEIAEAPRTDVLSGNVIELDSLVSGLKKGKLLIISGKRKTALVTKEAAGLELISADGEKKQHLWPDDVLRVLEPPVKKEDKMLWKLMDRNGFTGFVAASDGSIQLGPAAPQDPVISEVTVLEGIFENALPKKLKVIEQAFKGDVSAAKNKGLKGTEPGEIFEGGFYQVVGWNGEPYVALNKQVNKLTRIVLEQDTGEKKTVSEGEAWSVGKGWKLSVQKIVRKASQKMVHLALTKDGIQKGGEDVAEGSVYTYVEKNIAGKTEVPLFVTYIDSIFTESKLKTVNFKYTWAAGTDTTEINIGSEFILPDDIPGTRERTVLVLEKTMQNSYDPFTVVIYANVARATHGETVHEVVGSGNGAHANQRFTLNKQPVTYISAPTPSGAESTIEMRVNDVKWQEVPSLYGLDEWFRGYITRIDDNGRCMIIFGDGRNGARLPTGQENISATYRTGIGMEGMVRAGQLSLLMTRPLGVKGVINPLAPTGAADPESRDQAKQNAPQKVLTLDRIVSLQDFEDFTHAFTGIGKTQATWLWDGERRFVHITIASVSGGTVDKTSELYKNVWLGIERVKDPVQQFRIDSFNPLFFNLTASVLVDSRYIKEKVLAAVKGALKQAFSFEQRSFGQVVTESELFAVMQKVEGVEAVDLNALYMKGEPPDLNVVLKASHARHSKGSILPADLLMLNPDGIELTEMIL